MKRTLVPPPVLNFQWISLTAISMKFLTSPTVTNFPRIYFPTLFAVCQCTLVFGYLRGLWGEACASWSWLNNDWVFPRAPISFPSSLLASSPSRDSYVLQFVFPSHDHLENYNTAETSRSAVSTSNSKNFPRTSSWIEKNHWEEPFFLIMLAKTWLIN